MLRTAPWKRLPLTIRWLLQNYKLDFNPDSLPPTHMAIAYGPVAVKRVGPAEEKKSIVDADPDLDDLPPLTQSSRPRCAVCSKKMTVRNFGLVVKKTCGVIKKT